MKHSFYLIPKEPQKLAAGTRESSRESAIANGSILLILTRLRSSIPGALTRASGQLLRFFGYTSLLLCSCLPAAEKCPPSEAPDGRVNYPANFQVDGGINLFVFGDYLYWTANEDGLYFAQTGSAHPRNGFDGTIQRIDPEWKSGMRLGAGLNFPKSGYDTLFTWTWFSAEGHASAHSHSGTLLPLWAEPSFPTFTEALQAEGKWDLDLNVYDLEWGRSSWFGGQLSLRPFFGLRAAAIDQELKNHFTYATHPLTHSHLHSKSDFQGGGLRAGIDSRFALPAGFAIYGLASGSLLYGRSDAGLTIRQEGVLIAHTGDKFWKGISSLQLGLGAGWDTHFAKDRLHLEFHVGWEQNIWFTVNQMNHYMHQLNAGSYFKESSNLSTQGLVAGGRFDF